MSRSNYQQEEQTQRYKSQLEAQAQIQYYVYQDLQNVVNLLYSMKAVIQYFKEDPQHPMIDLCNNKLVLQLNLSNGIHQDLLQQCQNTELFQFLDKQKQNAQKMLDQILSQMFGQEKLKEQLCLVESYKNNCLGKNFQWRQYEQKQTNLPVQFNEQVLKKIINSIQFIDNKINQVGQNGELKQPIVGEIQYIAQQYEQLTQNKLQLNFPLFKNSTSIQSNNKSFQEQNNCFELQQNQNYNNQYCDYNKQGQNNFLKECVDITQTAQPQNGNYKSNEQYSNNLNNQQQLQNKLIEFLKKFELPINNNTHPTIQNILNSINNNYEKLKEDIKKLSQYPNSNFKTQADYAISQRSSGNLREQFRLHQIFHLFYSYLDAENKNGRIINIFEYLTYVKISYQNDSGNFLIYFEQQKCILQKQPHFVNQQNSSNLNNQLYWQDDYYYELFKNFSNIYGYQII
ncbi:unnamed protein product [Paramecium sonneborni]|uniref:Uncharacterized protein n=1 Tax=Paramecium sonneborni TaxID=65129 RepID=A0A8S1NDD2_9CILI|nr:unnamed protein product [Paramecium sonneborni]